MAHGDYAAVMGGLLVLRAAMQQCIAQATLGSQGVCRQLCAALQATTAVLPSSLAALHHACRHAPHCCVTCWPVISHIRKKKCANTVVVCAAAGAAQVLLYNLLPPPGSPPLQEDVPGEAWTPPPLAAEVQSAVVDAIEQVRVHKMTCETSCCCSSAAVTVVLSV